MVLTRAERYGGNPFGIQVIGVEAAVNNIQFGFQAQSLYRLLSNFYSRLIAVNLKGVIVLLGFEVHLSGLLLVVLHALGGLHEGFFNSPGDLFEKFGVMTACFTFDENMVCNLIGGFAALYYADIGCS